MNKKASNMSAVKKYNRSLILKLFKQKEEVSRKDIAQLVGLTPAAVTIIINEMIEEGIIKEKGQMQEDKKVGRKKILVDINYQFKYVLGINIESNGVEIGITDLAANLICSKVLEINKNLKIEKMIKMIIDECIGLMWSNSILKEDVLGIGVGIIGTVDIVEGISCHAYGLWNEKVYIKEVLEEALGLRVVIDNNVRCLALAEMDFGIKSNVGDIMFIKYGPGIGSAVILNNNLYYGSNYAAGEIGHMIVNADGPLCRCGQKGCLEVMGSKETLIKNIKTVFSKEKMPILYDKVNGEKSKISIKYVLEAFEEGDVSVEQEIRNIVFYIGIGIINSFKLYDPNRIILYTKLFKNAKALDMLIESLNKMDEKEDWENIIIQSNLNTESKFLGGVALAIRKFFFDTGGRN